jgi:hypothetical protein
VKKSGYSFNWIVHEWVWTVVAIVMWALLKSWIGGEAASLVALVAVFAGVIFYIRLVDWLDYRRARPDLARPLFPGRRQGGLANGGGAATMGKGKRQPEDRG